MFKLDERIRPILKWAGGKSHLLPQLTRHFPPRFHRFLEPFMGSGACFFSLNHGVPAILNDQNEELIHLYRTVRGNPKDLMVALDRYRKLYSEEFFYKLRRHKPSCKVEQAARTVFLNKTGFNGLYRQNLSGEFNVPFGKRPHCPKLYDRENLLRASKRLSKARLFSKDFSSILKMAGRGDFVYCDPPYEPLSRTSSFNSYRRGGFSKDEQRRLMSEAEAARKRGATVIISNSHAPFILDLYNEHAVHKVKARRSINSKGDGRQEIFEVLIEMV